MGMLNSVLVFGTLHVFCVLPQQQVELKVYKDWKLIRVIKAPAGKRTCVKTDLKTQIQIVGKNK